MAHAAARAAYLASKQTTEKRQSKPWFRDFTASSKELIEGELSEADKKQLHHFARRYNKSGLWGRHADDDGNGNGGSDGGGNGGSGDGADSGDGSGHGGAGGGAGDGGGGGGGNDAPPAADAHWYLRLAWRVRRDLVEARHPSARRARLLVALLS